MCPLACIEKCGTVSTKCVHFKYTYLVNCYRLVKLVETVTDNLVILFGEEEKFALVNIAWAVSCPNSSLETLLVLGVNGPRDIMSLEHTNISFSQKSLTTQENVSVLSPTSLVSFSVPFKLLHRKEDITNLSRGCPYPQLSFSVFRTDKLFRTSQSKLTTSVTVVSNIINARIGKKDRSSLPSPVEIEFAISSDKTVNPWFLCVTFNNFY